MCSTGTKVFYAKYLIDDLPRNLWGFEGQGILYTVPHNLKATGFVRVNNWREAAMYFADVAA
jgi:5'(3')-deoxyribonucleotidase